MTGAQTWQASLHGDQAVVIPAAKPRWFHEMATRTVPLRYLDEFDALQDHADTDVTWGVQLPQGTRDAIRKRMQGRQGGELVIDASGAVSVEGQGHATGS